MSDREEKKKKGPFGVDEVRLELKNVRQAVKNRWLVCYDDSEVGNRNPKTNNATAATDFKRLIGVAVIIVNKKNEVLVGKRMGSHGAGTWALPGGHIDEAKPSEECEAKKSEEERAAEKKAAEEEAKREKDTEDGVTKPAKPVETEQFASEREVKEETDLDIEAQSVVHTTWEYFEENEANFKYYNTFFVWATMIDPDQEVVNREKKKCAEWKWMSWEELRSIWEAYPVIEDQPEDKEAGMDEKQKKRAAEAKAEDASRPANNKLRKLFLPLAKLVRDYPELQALKTRNEAFLPKKK